MQKQILGKLGEQLAKKHLLNKGYKLLAQNFHSKFGEIDLIFQDEKIVVFVEVKTRVGDFFGPPEEAINKWKIRSLIKTAQYFQLLNPSLPKAIRIDAVCLQFDEITHRLASLKHFENITL